MWAGPAKPGLQPCKRIHGRRLWVGGAVMAVGTALAVLPGAGVARRRDCDGAEAERRSSDGVSA